MQGKASPIRNHYNAVTVETVETAAAAARFAIEARAYDDGVAFRYAVPEQPALEGAADPERVDAVPLLQGRRARFR